MDTAIATHGSVPAWQVTGQTLALYTSLGFKDERLTAKS
jgi:hypothetical protein